MKPEGPSKLQDISLDGRKRNKEYQEFILVFLREKLFEILLPGKSKILWTLGLTGSSKNKEGVTEDDIKTFKEILKLGNIKEIESYCKTKGIDFEKILKEAEEEK